MRAPGLVAAAAAGLMLAGCAGTGGDPAPGSSAVASANPSLPAGSAQASYQGALERLDARRAILLGARTSGAIQFNSTEGTDRDVAAKIVKAACADLRDAYFDFDVAVRSISFPDAAGADVDALVAATTRLIGYLDLYQDATEGPDYVRINNQEMPATEEWQRRAAALADLVGAPGLPGWVTATPTPAATGAGAP